MRNAKNLDTVHTHTHTHTHTINLSAISIALFSVEENKYSKLKANKLV